MDGNTGSEFFQLGYVLFKLGDILNPYYESRYGKTSLPELKAEIDDRYKKLEQFILEKQLIPAMSSIKSQTPNRTALCILSYVAYGMTTSQHYSCLVPQNIARTLAVLELDNGYIEEMLRVSALINELLVLGHLVMRGDREIELSVKNKCMVSRYHPFIFGMSKNELEAQQAKRRAKAKRIEAPKLKYTNRFKVKFPKFK